MRIGCIGVVLFQIKLRSEVYIASVHAFSACNLVIRAKVAVDKTVILISLIAAYLYEFISEAAYCTCRERDRGNRHDQLEYMGEGIRLILIGV